MKPGNPWSVKGIQPAARQAAKDAARRHGMTLGQWLNHVIMEGGPETDQQPQQQQPQAVEPQPAPAPVPDPQSQSLHDKIEDLSSKLDLMTRVQTARPEVPHRDAVNADAWQEDRLRSFAQPAHRHYDDNRAAPSSSSTRLGNLDSRLSALTHKIETMGSAPAPAPRPSPQAAPSNELEDALRNVVDRIEINDQQNSDVLKTIQSRLSELSSRTTASSDENVQQLSSTIHNLEDRLSELGQRLASSSDEVHRMAHSSDKNAQQISELDQRLANSSDVVHRMAHSSDKNAQQISELDQRLASSADEVHRMAHSSDKNAQQISELSQRLANSSDVVHRMAHSSDETAQEMSNTISQLETRLSELAIRLSDASSENSAHLSGSISQLETRLSEFDNRLERTEADTQRISYIDELERKVEGLASQNATNLAAQSKYTSASADLYDRVNRLSDIADLNERRLEEFKTQDISGFEQRISSLASRLDEPQADPQIAVLEERTEYLATKLEEVLQDPSSSSAVDVVEKQLVEISDRLKVTETRFDKLSPLEDSINQLFDAFARNQGWTKDAIASAKRDTISQMEGIAESAAEVIAKRSSDQMVSALADDGSAHQDVSNAIDALRSEMRHLQAKSQTDASAPGLEDITAPLMALQQELSQLSDDSKNTDHRNQDTLEAIHETLGKVVGRLSILESVPTHENFVPPLQAPDVNVAQEQEPEISGNAEIEIEHSTRYIEPQLDELTAAVSDEIEDPKTPDVESSAERPEPELNHDFLAAARKAARIAAQTPKTQSEKNEGDAAVAAKPKSKLKFFALAANDDKKRKTLLLATAAVLLIIGAISAASLMGGKSVNTANSTSTPKASSTVSAPAAPAAPKTTKAISPANPKPMKLEISKPDEMFKSQIGDKMPSVPDEPLSAAAHKTNLTPPQTTASIKPAKTARIVPVAPPAPKLSSAPLPPESIGPLSLRKAAASGNARAQFEIASRYATGRLVPQNFATAISWYQRAAAQGLAPAQYRLGTYYEKGRGVTKDKTSARIWYERAAANGNLKAIHNLAVIYADSSKSKPQFAKAGLWFRKAAEFGLTDSQYNLAILHERGLGVSKDMSAAYFWFQIAGKQGDKDAAARAVILEKTMTQDQIARSRLLINNWKPRPLNQSANEVIAPANGWQSAQNATPGDNSVFSNHELVVLSQGYLSKLGYDPGPVDGILGEQTRDAIRAFERRQNMPVVGLVNPQVVNKLKQAAS